MMRTLSPGGGCRAGGNCVPHSRGAPEALHLRAGNPPETPAADAERLPWAPVSHDPLRLDHPLRDRLDRLGKEFLADILGREAGRRPRNVPALAELAHVLTRLGRIEDGLRIDRRLVELEPRNPTIHYNLACSLSLLERPDEALDELELAAELGYDDPGHLREDEDLLILRGEPRFQTLVRRLEARQGQSLPGAE